jgi:putative transposase
MNVKLERKVWQGPCLPRGLQARIAFITVSEPNTLIGFVALRRWVRNCIRSPVANKMPKTKDAPRKTLPAGIGKVLKRLHYPLDVIVLCVRWYVAYSLNLRNLEEMMAERGVEVDHSSVHRWVIKLVPLFEKAFRRRKRPVRKSWRMDETYVKVKGQWKYRYRAVDKQGNTVDFLLRAHRDKAAAHRYFEKAIDRNCGLETITVDKSGANLAALEALNAERSTPIKVRQNKYLNNIVEQDHRAIKRIIKPMMGFKDFRCARIILAGIELMHMIRIGQMQDDGFAKTAVERFYSLAI